MKSTVRVTLLLTAAMMVVAGCELPPCFPPAPPAAPKPQPCDISTGSVTASMALPTGVKSTSAVWVEKTGPKQVIAQKEFSYQIKVTNLTKLTLMDVVVKETVPAEFKVAKTAPEAKAAGGTLTWALGQMAPQSTKVMVVTGMATKASDFAPCTSITYQPPALCLPMNACEVNLAVTKTGPESVIVCDPITYVVTVKNTGSCQACNVVVKDVLPDGVMTVGGKQAVEAQLGNLAPGESKQLTIRAKASKTGKFCNSAEADASNAASAKSNQVCTTVTAPKLAVAKAGPAMRYIGRPTVYNITVSNTGDAPAKNTMLTDRLAAGARFQSATEGGTYSGGSVVWNLGTLAPGAKKSVAVTVIPTAIGSIHNTAVARAYCADGQAETKTEIKGIPAILLETIDLQDPIEVGANETYVITVTNQGSAVDKNVVIVCTLPAQQEFVSANGPTAGKAAGKVVTFAPLAELAPKARAVYRVVVKSTSDGDVRFRTKLTSDMLKTSVDESESTHIYK